VLTTVASALPARHPVTLTSDDARLTLTTGPVTYTMITLPGGDYPRLPEPGEHAAEFDARALAAAVSHASKAAGKDDTLPALTCIRLVLDGQEATLTATDRYRLTIVTCPFTPGPADAPGPALIPARELTAVTRRTSDTTARLALTAETATLTAADRQVTMRLISGEFPDVTRLIPGTAGTAVTADIATLTGAVRRAAVVAERNTPVRFGFTAGEALIESGTGDEASLTEAVPVTLDGDPLTIAFNPAYFLDALATIAGTGTATARLAMTGPAKPAVITPAAADPATCTHVLMPIRLAG
jgi:DNA polymerase III subunit beta